MRSTLLRTVLAAGVALSALTFVGAGSASAAPVLCDLPLQLPTGSAAGLDNLCAKEGDLLDVRIGDVHATQPSLGYDEVYYKLGRYTLGKDEINKKFDDWCEANGQVEAASATPESRLDDPASFTCAVAVGKETADSIEPMKTVVIGPGGTLYLTDGHHTLTSFYETPDGGPNLHVRLRVLGNLSGLSYQDFWAEMKKNKWVWTQDVDGDEVAVDQLPSGVGLRNFADDKYRSLMYFARDIGFTAGTIPFQEFYWGAWLRDDAGIDLGTWNAADADSYLATVDAIARAQVALPKDSIVENGRTASELGALGAWNDGKARDKGEFGKLSKPYSDEKPGKIAYSMQYKNALGQ